MLFKKKEKVSILKLLKASTFFKPILYLVAVNSFLASTHAKEHYILHKRLLLLIIFKFSTHFLVSTWPISINFCLSHLGQLFFIYFFLLLICHFYKINKPTIFSLPFYFPMSLIFLLFHLHCTLHSSCPSELCKRYSI